MAEFNNELDETLLEKPCSYCHELYPEQFLFDHQYLSHQDILQNPGAASQNDDVDESLMEIPCQKCGRLFVALVMTDHEAICGVLPLDEEQQFRAEVEIQQRNRFSEELQNESFNVSEAFKEVKEVVKPENSREANAENANKIKANREEANIVQIKELKVEQKTKVKPQDSNEAITEKASEIKVKREESNIIKMKESKVEPKTESLILTTGASPNKYSQNEKLSNNFERKVRIQQTEMTKSFGSNAEFSKDFEKNQSYSNMSHNPIFEYADQDDDDDDDLIISDDDCEESLEDFWSRTREVLRCRKLKNTV